MILVTCMNTLYRRVHYLRIFLYIHCKIDLIFIYNKQFKTCYPFCIFKLTKLSTMSVICELLNRNYIGKSAYFHSMSLVCPVATSIKVQWKMSGELVTISRDMIDCEGTFKTKVSSL